MTLVANDPDKGATHPPMTDARLLPIILALPFLGSLGAAFLPTRGRNRAALLAGAVALAGLVLTVGFYPVLAHGETMRLVIPWLPSLGLDLPDRNSVLSGKTV